MLDIFLSKAVHNIFFIFILFALQFFLASRKNKWLGFLLPAWYFLHSFSATYAAVQSGLRIHGSLLLTIVCYFVIANTDTAILLLIYHFVHPKESQAVPGRQGQEKQTKLKAVGEQTANIAVPAAALTILVVGMVVVLFGAISWFYVFANSGQEQAESTANQYPYVQVIEGERYGGLPVMLEDLGADVLAYRYVKSRGFIGPITTSSNIVDSTIDNVESPEKEFTLKYTVWRQNSIKIPFLLSLKEKTLQISRGGNLSQAQYDYGANQAYWIGDCLLLRYADTVIFFDESSTKDLLDSPACAAFMREKYGETV